MEKDILEFYKGKRVLVTGHTGFKGSWLCRILVNAGAAVTGYALKPPTEPDLFSMAGLEGRMESVIGDIRDLEKLKKTFEAAQPEIVFHLAAQPIVRDSYKDPVYTYETNVMGTVHIMECARLFPCVRSLLNVTTDKVYENREWEYGYRETDRLDGYDPYSNSKSCSELVTPSYKKSFFTDGRCAVSTCRAGNVIGGGDWAVDRLVPDLMRSAAAHREEPLRSPESVRPWQHVLEPLSGYLQLAGKLYEGKQEFADAWNFGPVPAAAITVREAAAALQRGWPDVRFRAAGDPDAPHEAGQLRLDCSKAQSLLRWHGVWDAETSFRRTAEWYRDFYLHNQVNTPGDFDAYFESAAAAEMEWMK